MISFGSEAYEHFAASLSNMALVNAKHAGILHQLSRAKKCRTFLSKKGTESQESRHSKSLLLDDFVCWMDAVSTASILVAALIVCNAGASSLELLCEGLKRGGADRAFKELFKSLRIFDDVQCLADSFGARPVHDFQVALYSRAEGA